MLQSAWGQEDIEQTERANIKASFDAAIERLGKKTWLTKNTKSLGQARSSTPGLAQRNLGEESGLLGRQIYRVARRPLRPPGLFRLEYLSHSIINSIFCTHH